MTTQNQKIEILPEDLDKAVEETKALGHRSTKHCLLAQVGKRVTGQEVTGCSWSNVLGYDSETILYTEGADQYVRIFDDFVESIAESGIDMNGIATLRSLLPVDITPTCSD